MPGTAFPWLQGAPGFTKTNKNCPPPPALWPPGDVPRGRGAKVSHSVSGSRSRRKLGFELGPPAQRGARQCRGTETIAASFLFFFFSAVSTKATQPCPHPRPALSSSPGAPRRASDAPAGAQQGHGPGRGQRPAPCAGHSGLPDSHTGSEQKQPPPQGAGAERKSLAYLRVGEASESRGRLLSACMCPCPSRGGRGTGPCTTRLQGRTAVARLCPKGHTGTQPGCGAKVGGGVPSARDVFPGNRSSSSSPSFA